MYFKIAKSQTGLLGSAASPASKAKMSSQGRNS